MDNRRLFLLAVFGFSLLMLWDAWQKSHQAPPPAAIASSTPPAAASAGVPVPTTTSPNAAVPAPNVAPEATASNAPKATVRTDVVLAEVSAQGGDLVRLELRKYKATGDKDRSFLLFDSGEKHVYEGQSGLIGAGLPNHKTLWQLTSASQELKDGEDAVHLALEAPIEGGGKVVKTYTFHRGNYLIDVEYQVINQGTAALQPSAYSHHAGVSPFK